jgi:hypothetical protein
VIPPSVYGVRRGAPETAADRQLREAAARVYRTYADRRARFVEPDQTGTVAPWRGWLGEIRAAAQ